MKLNILSWLFVICSLVSMSIAIHYDSFETNQNITKLNLIQKQIDSLKQSQTDQENKLADYQTQIVYTITAEAADTGEASYYDYTLPEGWSSLNHRVCASRNYKKGTTLEVTNTHTKAKVDCLVTDFGPDNSVFPERIIDLSSFAFSQIAPLSDGVINVSIKEIVK